MRVQAAVAETPGRPLSVETVDLGGLGPNDILVEAKAAGLCHSDLHVLQGNAPGYIFPSILGHEGAGVVIECGERVTRLKAGDHVVTCVIGECGHCAGCRSDRTNLCETRGVEGLAAGGRPSRHFSKDGQSISTLAGGAAFAAYTILDQDFATAIPKSIAWDVACLFGCAVLTGVGSVLYTAKVRAGDAVAIFGLGGIGLNVIDGAKMAGASRIIGVDLNPAKEDLARELGLTDFFDGRDTDVAQHIRALTGGGVQHAFECTGSVTVARSAWLTTRVDCGQLILIGAAPPDRDRFEITIGDIQLGRVVLGGVMGKAKPRTDLAAIIDRFVAGDLHTNRLVSHHLRLSEINEGFRMMDAGESIRSVVMF
jgi:S-(hydroxymethyl)glutathione dehydrogenase / alcohol dehydrogenase